MGSVLPNNVTPHANLLAPLLQLRDRAKTIAHVAACKFLARRQNRGRLVARLSDLSGVTGEAVCEMERPRARYGV